MALEFVEEHTGELVDVLLLEETGGGGGGGGGGRGGEGGRERV